MNIKLRILSSTSLDFDGDIFCLVKSKGVNQPLLSFNLTDCFFFRVILANNIYDMTRRNQATKIDVLDKTRPPSFDGDDYYPRSLGVFVYENKIIGKNYLNVYSQPVSTLYLNRNVGAFSYVDSIYFVQKEWKDTIDKLSNFRYFNYYTSTKTLLKRVKDSGFTIKKQPIMSPTEKLPDVLIRDEGLKLALFSPSISMDVFEELVR